VPVPTRRHAPAPTLRVLLTGFEPFGGERVNPAERLVRALVRGATPHARVRLAAAIVPVDRARYRACLDDAVRRHRPHVLLAVGQATGRPALAAAGPAFAPEQLAHHGLGIRALGERMAMAPMGGKQDVVPVQPAADAGGNRLLADRRMDRAEHQPAFLRGEPGFLERPDPRHGPVKGEHALMIDIRLRHPPEPPRGLSQGGIVAVKRSSRGGGDG
jgi:hypothetical protein